MKQLFWVALGLIAASSPAPAAPAAPWHQFHYENVLGTSFELKLTAPSASDADAARVAALAEIDRLARIFSGYDAASEFSRWQRTQGTPVSVSPELLEVLGLFDQWRQRTAGALDPAAAVVCDLWKQAARRQQLPTPAELDAAVTAARQPHWRLDAAAGTATHLDATPLILNSFTKSYIASRAADVVRARPGVGAVVVNIGGDLVIRGDVTETVDIADPMADAENSPAAARLKVRDAVVATSGGYRRFSEIGGKRFSHIVDPRTGQPVDHIASATVVAARATDAGALATSLCVLTPVESLRVVAEVPGAECLLITRDGRRVTSPGWSRVATAPALLAAAGDLSGLFAAPLADAADGPRWDPAFELTINLELARIEGQRAKRPYVAVWVEDADKFPVRTVALWYAKPKWLPDLKSWTHAEKLRTLTDDTDVLKSASSATRSPGKYTLKWDGKDDHGKLVKPGKYTVFIEVAREHGTHQVMRQEMDFSGNPQKVELKSNVEVGSASLDYQRKTGTR